MISFFFFFNDTATTEIYTLSLHDALPISSAEVRTNHDLDLVILQCDEPVLLEHRSVGGLRVADVRIDTVPIERGRDRKSTRLNSSHSQISYAVFCLKKKKNNLTMLNNIKY